MYKLTDENDIVKLASEITCNSELFGDEINSVVYDLVKLWEDTVNFGCDFTRKIDNMWGSEVTVVTRCPKKFRRHQWVC